MNKHSKMSKKGWKFYSAGNVVATWSSVFIGIAMLIAIILLIPVVTANNPVYSLSAGTQMICLLGIIILSALALLFVLIGKLLFWKGLTYVLGALQIPKTIIPEEVVQEAVESTQKN